jgi:hypothetical protein
MKKLKTVSRKRFNFLTNPFEVQTRKSYRKMLSVATKTHNILKGLQPDPFFAALFAEIEPAMLDYANLYGKFFGAFGSRKGNTLGLRLMMKELNHKKLPQWEGQVRALFPEGTAEETAIFLNKRKHFQSGPYATRINTVGVLAKALLQYPALAATQADVQLWYEQALALRNKQVGSKGLYGMGSSELEQQRIALADTLYGIMGRLMHHHKSNRDMVATYFDFHRLFGARRKYVEVVEEE